MAWGWMQGTEEQMFEDNVRFLRELLPYAKEKGVILCLENMPLKSDRTFSTVEEWKAVLDTVNDPLVKACLDTGHLSAMGVDLYDAVVQMGDYIVAMHVHDDKFGQDRHLPPFQGNLNWAGFIKGLKEIHFDGCISLETGISLSTPEPMRERMQIELANVARYIADEIEK
jgi:sugar phosphate isomerase/epimerase